MWQRLKLVEGLRIRDRDDWRAWASIVVQVPFVPVKGQSVAVTQGYDAEHLDYVFYDVPDRIFQADVGGRLFEDEEDAMEGINVDRKNGWEVKIFRRKEDGGSDTETLKPIKHD